jgi:hypothetical protein
MPQDSLNEGKQALHSFNILMWDSKESQFNISTHTQVWIWKSLIVQTNAEGMVRISKITYRKTNSYKPVLSDCSKDLLHSFPLLAFSSHDDL